MDCRWRCLQHSRLRRAVRRACPGERRQAQAVYTRTSHITHHTHHTSHITHHTSHTSHITHHTSHITHHKTHLTHHKSHITHHTSHITHHTSHITHHNSHVTPHTQFTILKSSDPFDFSCSNNTVCTLPTCTSMLPKDHHVCHPLGETKKKCLMRFRPLLPLDPDTV